MCQCSSDISWNHPRIVLRDSIPEVHSFAGFNTFSGVRVSTKIIQGIGVFCVEESTIKRGLLLLCHWAKIRKVATRKFPEFSNSPPEFSRFCVLHSWETETLKIYQQSPPFFNAKFLGMFTKALWRAGKLSIGPTSRNFKNTCRYFSIVFAQCQQNKHI